MNTMELLKKIKNILLEEIKDLEAIVVFGSYARNKQKDTSDIDIAIKPNIELSNERMLEIKNKLEEEILIDVHLINLNIINEDFKYEILISGKTLFCKNEYDFEMYKCRIFGNYLQFSEDRKIIIDKIKNGGTLYGK